MATIRRLYKIFSLICLNIFFLLVGLLIISVPFVKKEARLKAAVRGMMLWARATCRVLCLKVETSGKYADKKGVFVVSNHSSYTDIPVIGGIIPSIFVAKHEVSSWFLFGLLSRIGGTVFVNRQSKSSTMKAVGEARERLLAGTSIVIFPEGTTDNGWDARDFRSSFFSIPIDTRATVLPVSIFYSRVDGRPTSERPVNEMAWHGNRGLWEHFWGLLSKRRIDVKVHFGSPISGPWAGDRKELASVSCQRVREGLSLLQGKGPF